MKGATSTQWFVQYKYTTQNQVHVSSTIIKMGLIGASYIRASLSIADSRTLSSVTTPSNLTRGYVDKWISNDFCVLSKINRLIM